MNPAICDNLLYFVQCFGLIFTVPAIMASPNASAV